MRENRREGVGREVRKWDRLFFSSSYHRLILLAFALVVVVSSGVSPCVSLLACLSSCGARAFSFRRPSVVLVVPMFVSFARRLSSFLRLVVRLVVCLSGAGRWIDCGMRWGPLGREMIGMGRGCSSFLSCLFVLICPPGYDPVMRSSRPPCLRRSPLPLVLPLSCFLLPFCLLAGDDGDEATTDTTGTP